LVSTAKGVQTLKKNHPRDQFKAYRSMRLPNYDYRTAGAYAITICAKERWRCLLDIPTLDNILKKEWNDLSQHSPGVATNLLVIMPDHLHCILWLQTQKENARSVSDIIRSYKSASSNAWLHHLKITGEEHPGKIWQKSFYDHIIRHERDLNVQRTYMFNNPYMAELKKKQAQTKDACTYTSCGHIPFPPN
jgi:putative transposase